MTSDEIITALTDALDLINRQKAEIERLNKELKKIKSDLKWWLNTNEEKGVVYIPEHIVRKMTEGNYEISIDKHTA